MLEDAQSSGADGHEDEELPGGGDEYVSLIGSWIKGSEEEEEVGEYSHNHQIDKINGRRLRQLGRHILGRLSLHWPAKTQPQGRKRNSVPL